MFDCEFCLMYERQGERAVVRYAGDVNCPDAYVGLQDDAAPSWWTCGPVRSEITSGIQFSRRSGERAISLEWQRFPDGTTNGRFVEQLREAGVPGCPYLFAVPLGCAIGRSSSEGRDGGGSRTGVERL
jgi:hypothetical protein